MRTFSTKILTSKLGGAHYMWVYLYTRGYVEKYHICGLKVGVLALYVGAPFTWVFTVFTAASNQICMPFRCV